MAEKNSGQNPKDVRSASGDEGRQQADADFLVETFGVPEREAGRLVARDGVAPETIERRAYRHSRGKDDTIGAPTPEPSRSERAGDADKEALKPVLRRRPRSGS